MSTAPRKEDTAMLLLKRVLALVAIVSVGFAFASCDRNITVVEETQTAQSCFACHSDTTTFLVAAERQWENSIHASGHNIDRNSSSCSGCHTSEGFVARTKGQSPGTVADPTVIHCFTCHAPHSDGDFALRWNSIATLQDGTQFDLGGANICVACHQSRRNVNTYVSGSPELSEHWGPHHSNQGDMLIGSNGYEYANFQYERTNHRSATEDGCLDCHFKVTRNNVVGGHSFNMEYEFEGTEILNVGACEDCHGEIDDFREIGFGYSAMDSVDVLIAQLDARLEATRLWHDGHPVDGVTTTADSAGAVWNLLMAEEDRSHGAHNYRYTMGLLRSSILYLDGQLPQTGPTALRR